MEILIVVVLVIATIGYIGYLLNSRSPQEAGAKMQATASRGFGASAADSRAACCTW